MNVLAFDTCFHACSAAVVTDAGGSWERATGSFERMSKGHAERLIPMIDEVMRQAGLDFGDLSRIGVTVGPGSFSGTRIGVAAARAFALAYHIPLVGLSPLALMAREAALWEAKAGPFHQPILVCVDVRRGEVYVQLFDSSGQLAHGPSRLLTIEAAASLASDHAAMAVGSGAEAVVALTGSAHKCRLAYPDLAPDALHAVTFVTSAPATTASVSPLYLRPPDAKPSADAHIQRP